MIAPDLETGILRLRELVDEAKTVVPFTGAGISTECGIPDFRSPGGLWTKMKPIDFGDFLVGVILLLEEGALQVDLVQTIGDCLTQRCRLNGVGRDRE